MSLAARYLEGQLVVKNQKEDAHALPTSSVLPSKQPSKQLVWEACPIPPPQTPRFQNNTIPLKVIGCSICGSDLEKLRYRDCPEGTVLGHELAVENLTPLTVKGITYPPHQRFAMAHHVPCGTCHQCLSGAESMCESFKESNVYPGGFASHVWVSQVHADHVMFPIPDGFPASWASCVEPLGCVIRGVKRGLSLLPTETPTKLMTHLAHKPTALVVGLGFIGLLACQVYQQYGFDVIAIDPVDTRRHLAETSGWAVKTYPPEALHQLPEWLCRHGYHTAVDQVFFTVMRLNVWETVLPVLKHGAVGVIFASALGTAPDTGFIDPSVLYFREISLVSAYSPSLASLDEAAKMLWTGQISLEGILTDTFPMQEGQAALEAYVAHEAIKVFLSCSEKIESEC
jgi:L-iditol 2-dehydrogenase